MDKLRYIIAVVTLVTVPSALGLWYAIHPFARFWRSLGPRLTYLILMVPVFVLSVALYSQRDWLLGRDLGTSVLSIGLGLAAVAVATWIQFQRKKHLTQKILVGVPELSKTDRGRLLTEGIYGRVRNPRYLEFMLYVLAYVAFANHAGTWILWVLGWPGIHLVVLLEEQELRERFGQEYADYCARVPRYLPRRTS